MIAVALGGWSGFTSLRPAPPPGEPSADRATVPAEAPGRAGSLTMAEYLAALAPPGGHSIVVDDAADRDRANANLTGRWDGDLDGVADAFDYEWSVGQGGVVLMSKRFGDRQSQPQAHRPELLRCARAISALVSSTPYAPSRDDTPASLLMDLARSLSPEQLARLQQGHPIPVPALMPAQAELVVRAARCLRLAGAVGGWARLVDELAGLDKAYLAPRILERPGTDGSRSAYGVWRLHIPGSAGLPTVVPLSVEGTPVGGGWPAASGASGPGEPVRCDTRTRLASRARVLLHTSLSETLAANLRRPVSIRAPATTASELVRSISEQAGVRVDVDPSLADRRLAAWLNGIAARQAIEALTDLEDWTWRAESDARVLLTPRTHLSGRNLAELSAAVRATLPVDLRRSLWLGMAPGEIAGPSSDSNPCAGLAYEVARRQAVRDLSARRAIHEWAERSPRQDERIPWSKVARPVQERILFVLVTRAVSQSDFSFLQGQARPYDLDLSSAELQLQRDSMLMVGVPGLSGRGLAAGFGVSVAEAGIVPRP